MTLYEILPQLYQKFSGQIPEASEFRGEYTCTVPATLIKTVCSYLKESFAFDLLLDLSGVDNYGQEPRFSVDYLLYSISHKIHLRLICLLPEENPEIDSVTSVWATANWHEREAWDMYGIRFLDHPNLKRILMWEGYPYHPLRKDFPLAGLPADLPDTAVDAGKVNESPMHGGPFITSTGSPHSHAREPRQHHTLAELIIKQKKSQKTEQD